MMVDREEQGVEWPAGGVGVGRLWTKILILDQREDVDSVQQEENRSKDRPL